MKRTIIITLISLAIISGVFLFGKHEGERNTQTRVTDTEKYFESLRKQTFYDFQQEFKVIGSQFQSRFMILDNENEVKWESLNRYPSSKPLILVRLRSSECNDCTDFVINEINKLSSKTNKYEFLVIYTCDSAAELEFTRKLLNKSIHLIRAKNNCLFNQLEIQDRPTVYLIDSDSLIQRVLLFNLNDKMKCEHFFASLT